MRKILALVWRELYTNFTDRNLILIMIATPLTLSTIIGLAFGGLGGDDAPIRDIPLAVVNLDEGNADGLNYGQIYAAALVPGATSETGSAFSGQTCPEAQPSSEASSNTLFDLTEAVQLDDPAAARAAVESGLYRAAIIIPADFTQRIAYTQEHPQVEAAAIEVYANSGNAITGEIVRSIVASITNQIMTGNIAVAATLDTLVARAQSDLAFGLRLAGAAASDSFQPNFGCAFTPAFNTLTIDRQTVAGEPARANVVEILVLIGSAQAMFFMLFTAQGGATDLFLEQRQGTLQRLFVSPTPRIVILSGKLIGTYINCVAQLALLALALTLVGSLFSGRLISIWGSNIIAVALVILAAALAGSGFGALILGIARTPEQGSLVGTVFNMAFGILGGGFGASFPREIAQFSMIYWGADAFNKLSTGNSDIALNVAILFALGVAMFVIGLWLFNRRFSQ